MKFDLPGKSVIINDIYVVSRDKNGNPIDIELDIYLELPDPAEHVIFNFKKTIENVKTK